MSGSSLILHCGGEPVTRDDLSTIVAPEPTRTWHPVPHSLLLETVEQSFGRAGFEIAKQQYGVSHEGNRFFGVMDLVSEITEGVNVAVGLRNSTDKSMPAAACLGEHVFVCDNLAFSAEVSFTRRHTARILADLPGLVDGAVAQVGAYRDTAVQRVEGMQQRRITDQRAHDLVVRAADARAVSWQDVPKVLQEWREPQHDEFKPRNAWSLYNAFTEVYKSRFGRNPADTASRTVRLNALLTETVLGN